MKQIRIVVDEILTTIRWLAWRLWGRRLAVNRMKKLAGLDGQLQPRDLALERLSYHRPDMARGPTITIKDAHLEHYTGEREKLPTPDYDDSGIN
jgi:hypothetical protein